MLGNNPEPKRRPQKTNSECVRCHLTVANISYYDWLSSKDMTSKRHHYLPQFYLRRFCRDGRLWVYDRDKDEFRQQTPNNTALEKHLYSRTTKDGQQNDEMEKIFAEAESLAKPVLDKIEKQEKITTNDKESLSWMLAMQFLRTPSFFEQSNAVWKAILAAKQLTPEQVPQKEYWLANVLDGWLVLREYYIKAGWRILCAPKNESFLTSDNSINVINPNIADEASVAPVAPEMCHYIPLSSQCCLFTQGILNGIAYCDFPKDDVREINVLNARNASKYIIVRDKPLLESIVSNTQLKHDLKGPLMQIRVTEVEV